MSLDCEQPCLRTNENILVTNCPYSLQMLIPISACNTSWEIHVTVHIEKPGNCINAYATLSCNYTSA